MPSISPFNKMKLTFGRRPLQKWEELEGQDQSLTSLHPYLIDLVYSHSNKNRKRRIYLCEKIQLADDGTGYIL